MTSEKELVKDEISEVVQNTVSGGELRIHFTPSVRPDRIRTVYGEKAAVTSTDGTTRRRSVTSIPPVPIEKEKRGHDGGKEEDKKNVDIDEHRMSPQEVADRYNTRINLEKPSDSRGLTSQESEQLLLDHGKNFLTPPKKRHPILKFLDYLRSLFNLLLILAGILEYILLGINFKSNFQNVSYISSLSNITYL